MALIDSVFCCIIRWLSKFFTSPHCVEYKVRTIYTQHTKCAKQGLTKCATIWRLRCTQLDPSCASFHLAHAMNYFSLICARNVSATPRLYHRQCEVNRRKQHSAARRHNIQHIAPSPALTRPKQIISSHFSRGNVGSRGVVWGWLAGWRRSCTYDECIIIYIRTHRIMHQSLNCGVCRLL